MLPAQVRHDNGWLRSAGWQPAHFFKDGHSACHLWTTTILDKPAPADAIYCPTCREAVKHGLV